MSAVGIKKIFGFERLLLRIQVHLTIIITIRTAIKRKIKCIFSSVIRPKTIVLFSLSLYLTVTVSYGQSGGDMDTAH